MAETGPKEGIRSFQIGDGMAMQLFVRDHHPVIVATQERQLRARS